MIEKTLDDAGTVLRYPVQPEPRIRLTRFSDIELGTQARFLVSTLIPQPGLVVIWGPPKCGKSFWAFDLLMHVALGWNYRGLRTRQGPVVYCAFEGQSGWPARKEAFRQRFLSDAQTKSVPLYLEPVRLDLIADAGELVEAIRAQLGAGEQPAAIALDTLNRSLHGSESSDEDMAAYVNAADTIKDAFGCSVLVIHHCGHGGDRPRGHSSLIGAADAVIKVTRGADNSFTSEVEVAKDGPQGHAVRSILEVVDVGVDDEGNAITSCIVLPVDEDGATPRGRDPRVAGASGIALALLRKAIDEAGQEAPPSSHIPPKSRTTTIETWRRYAYAGTIADSDKPDAKQKAFVRATKRLQAMNIIGVWNDQVWIK